MNRPALAAALLLATTATAAPPHASKPGPTRAHANRWDGEYTLLQHESPGDFYGFLCPGRSIDAGHGEVKHTGKYTVANGVLEFDAWYVPGPGATTHSYHLRVPLRDLPRGEAGNYADGADAGAVASIDVPIAPLRYTRAWDGTVYNIAALHVEARVFHYPESDVATGRMGDLKVTVDDATLCQEDRLVGKEFTLDYSKGSYCSQAQSMCTDDAQCCSGKCSAHHGSQGSCY